ncbi:MAG: response regulator [Thermodesulfobacteriota bacterium]
MTRSVLIVEDEVINGMALADQIPCWGCRVVDLVTSGEDAIRLAEEHRPDIVLMDINIHGSIDGLDAARDIIGRLGIPVVFMTGYSDKETVRKAEALGPAGFLVKPLDPAQLKAILLGT